MQVFSEIDLHYVAWLWCAVWKCWCASIQTISRFEELNGAKRKVSDTGTITECDSKGDGEVAVSGVLTFPCQQLPLVGILPALDTFWGSVFRLVFVHLTQPLHHHSWNRTQLLPPYQKLGASSSQPLVFGDTLHISWSTTPSSLLVYSGNQHTRFSLLWGGGGAWQFKLLQFLKHARELFFFFSSSSHTIVVFYSCSSPPWAYFTQFCACQLLVIKYYNAKAVRLL